MSNAGEDEARVAALAHQQNSLRGDRSFCPLKDPRLAQLPQALNAGGDRGVGGVPPTRTIVMNPMHGPSSSGASEVNYYSPPRLGRRGSADRGRDLGPLATHPAR
jgi:hypothetical protein